MPPREEENNQFEVKESEASYVKVILGKSGGVEIAVKAGKDADTFTADGQDRLSFLRNRAITIFKDIIEDDTVKPFVKFPKEIKQL